MPLLSDEQLGLGTAASAPRKRLLSDEDLFGSQGPLRLGMTPNPDGTYRESSAMPGEAAPAPEMTWGETFAKAKENIPSPGQYLLDQIKINPLSPLAPMEAAKSIGKVVLGTAENAIGPEKFNQFSDEQQTASDFWKHYKNYFSESGLKENISQRPLAVATDIASFALPGPKGYGAVTHAKPATAIELTKSGGMAIQAAKEAGVYFKPEFLNPLADTMTTIAEKSGYRPKHREIRNVLRVMDKLKSGEASFNDLHNVRMDINDAIKSKYDAERAIGLKMRETLDTFMRKTEESGGEGLRATGDLSPKQATDLFQAGIKEYAAGKKAQFVDELLKKAENSAPNFSASGAENAIRRRFIALTNSKEFKKFSPEEKALVEDITKGGRLSQAIGRFAARGPMSAALGSYLGTALEAATMGLIPPGAGKWIVYGTGEAGRRIAERRTRGAVERLSEHIRSNGGSHLKTILSEAVYDHVMNTPKGKQAVTAWLKSGGKQSAIRSLALVVAQSVNRPDLAGRIEKELAAIQPDDQEAQ